jgi:hypothetical protein
MIRLFLLLLFLLEPCQAEVSRTIESITAGLESTVVAAYRQRQVGPFTLYYHPADQDFAETVAIVIDQSRDQISQSFGLANFRNSKVVVAYDPVHFQALAGSSFPHWGAACAVPSKRLILLKSPRFSRNREHPGATVRHEMAHLAVGIICRDQYVPTWLNEGLAVIASGFPVRLGTDGMTLSKAIATGGLHSLKDLESLHGYSSLNADLAYREAEDAVRYFLKRFGRLALVQLLTEIGRGRAFPEAFDVATGGGWFRFESEWKEHLKARTGFHFLLDIKSWIWILAIFLACIAYWVKRRRAAKIMESWDEDPEIFDKNDPENPL